MVARDRGSRAQASIRGMPSLCPKLHEARATGYGPEPDDRRWEEKV
jgi:hypothetical protein